MCMLFVLFGVSDLEETVLVHIVYHHCFNQKLTFPFIIDCWTRLSAHLRNQCTVVFCLNMTYGEFHLYVGSDKHIFNSY